MFRKKKIVGKIIKSRSYSFYDEGIKVLETEPKKNQ